CEHSCGFVAGMFVSFDCAFDHHINKTTPHRKQITSKTFRGWLTISSCARILNAKRNSTETLSEPKTWQRSLQNRQASTTRNKKGWKLSNQRWRSKTWTRKRRPKQQQRHPQQRRQQRQQQQQAQAQTKPK